jgi:peptidoglycan hydrolase-like protein with peptidoglycan-binding domain
MIKGLAITACIILGSAVVFVESASAGGQNSSSPSHSAALKKSSTKGKKHTSRREPKQMAPTPERISEIQAALARNGYYQGSPSGKWDAATVASMQRFQADHGLDARGKIDALSLQKLGLGSEIAGVSAPRPVSPSPTNAIPAGPTPSTIKPPAPKLPEAPTGTPPASPGPATSQSATPNSKPVQPPQL